MSERFQIFMSQLKETHTSLSDYVDFSKVAANVDAISIKLHQLNYLIGQEDMAAAVNRLWNENPKVFSVLDILIAVRRKDNKKVIDGNGNVISISDYLSSPDLITVFLDQTDFNTKDIVHEIFYLFSSEYFCQSGLIKCFEIISII